MQIDLEKKYKRLVKAYDFESFIMSSSISSINTIIKNSIIKFMKEHRCVAIYGNGEHTRMLLLDFVFELKNVKYIINNYATERSREEALSDGYIMIREEGLKDCKIDGVILSSYFYRDTFKKSLLANNRGIDYLDLYDELEKKNINLNVGYYQVSHPYSKYQSINQIQNNIRDEEDYWKLLKRYIQMKDFLSAKKYAVQLFERYQNKKAKEFIDDIDDIILCMKDTIKNISKDNILMLCIDTLARDSLYGNSMPKLLDICHSKGKIYTKAYSYSTSTYESLIPVYSENSDLKTGYYTKSEVEEKDCRFIQKAKNQRRNIYFYTDGFNYINGKSIISREEYHSVSEKIWGFVIDAAKEKDGLFYLHVLYESHHPYPNPYYSGTLFGYGGSAVFDFFPKNGGVIRADYKAQLNASLEYLDDQLSYFLEDLDCRILLYSDHGMFIVEKETTLMDMRSTLLGADEERIQIPLVIFSPNEKKGFEDKLISLMELNNIMISILDDKEYHWQGSEYIKIGRSEIYSQNYIIIARKKGAEIESLAFEGFIFDKGYKLIVYSNNLMKLYNMKDEELEDKELKVELFNKINNLLTVI